MTFLPKEHGAFGQVAFPLLTAMAVAGTTVPAALIAFAVVGGFLAHEPLLVLLGMRGARAQQGHSTRAGAWLAALVMSGASAAALAVWWLPESSRWALLVPTIPVIPLAVAIVAGREKTWPAEICASLAFSGAAFPVAVAAGATIATAATIATVFALNFVLATLGVRAVILGVRGGGDPAAVKSMQRAVIALACLTPVALALGAVRELLPWTAPVAAVPGVTAALWFGVTLPPASGLRRLGWTLAGASALTAAILIVGSRWP